MKHTSFQEISRIKVATVNLQQSFFLLLHSFFIVINTHNMKFTVLTIYMYIYIHIIVQPSPPSITRNFHLPRLKLHTH